MKPKITWEYDDEYDKLDIYVDGKLNAEWAVYTTPEDSVTEFTRVFNLGINWAKKEQKKETFSNDELLGRLT